MKEVPEDLLPHAARERLHLRQRGLPRLLPVADEGQEDLRDLKAETAWGKLFAAYERGEADRTTGGLPKGGAAAQPLA